MRLAYLAPLSEESIITAHKLGYDAIEANLGWIDSGQLDEALAEVDTLKALLRKHKISITAVAIYGGTLEVKEEDAIVYWVKAMRMARSLRCEVVCGLTGRDNDLTVAQNMDAFERVFGRICEAAEELDVRIGLEPWPGNIVGHGPYRWTNLATTPDLWERLFERVPSSSLGLEFDPSHLAWQGIDYLQALRDFAARIVHVHAKGIVIDEATLRRVGVHGKGWWHFVLPGLGQIDWHEFFAVLREIDYRGDIAVEHEDREYMDDRWKEGLTIANKTLRPLVDVY